MRNMLSEEKALQHFGLELPNIEAIENERYRLATLLTSVANHIYNKQEKEYPSNILDIISRWLKGYPLLNEDDKWFYEALEKVK